MKKVLLVASMFCAMFCLLATSTQAQQGIKNSTACTQVVKLAYGNPFTCTATGTLVYTLAPNTSIWPLPFFAPEEIIAAKGGDAGFTCGIWYIGQPCSGYPLGVGVPCPTCGDYKVVLEPNGIVIYQ
ncbi:MAG: hypothetical protein ACFB10_05060 [Salibacteraceae bacterium]